MLDQNKTKDQLIRELDDLRLQVGVLEKQAALHEETEKLLEQGEARFKRLLDSPVVGIIMADLEGSITEANDAFLNMVGYRRADLPLRWDKMTPPEYLQADEQAVSQLRETGRTPPVAKEYFRKDGSRVPVLLGVSPMDESRRTCLCFVLDFSERRQAEEEYRTILRTAMDGFWLMDAQGRLLDVNDAYCRLTGYSREELLRMTISDLEIRESPAETARHIRQLMEVGWDRFETRHRCKDGRIADVEVSANYMPGERGTLFVFVRDITLRKRQAEALNKSREDLEKQVQQRTHELKVAVEAQQTEIAERKLAQAQLVKEHLFVSSVLDTSGALILVLDREGRIVRFNRTCEAVTGYSSVEVEGRPLWDLFLVPEEMDSVKAVFKELAAGQFPNKHENYWLTKDGKRRLISWSNTALTGEDGEVEYVLSSGIDITERKEAETALEFQATIVRDMQEGVCLVRASDATIAYANPKFERMFGYELGELTDKSVSVINYANAEKNAADTTREIIAKINETGEAEYEVHNVKKDGTPFWCRARTSRFDHPQYGTVYVAVQEDITARKLAEEQIKSLNAELQQRIARERDEHHKVQAQLDLVELELRIARKIQERMFPKEAPAIPGFDIAGATYPAQATGGDSFDFIPAAGSGLWIIIGDVSGHGFGPALLMADAHAYLHALTLNHWDAGEVLTGVNVLLADDVDGANFVTAIAGRLDPARRTFEYANAGHPTGYVLDSSGAVKETIASAAQPLGSDAAAQHRTAPTIHMASGDVLCLLTDGIMEARALDNSTFGDRRAQSVLHANRDKAAAEMIEMLYRSVREFSGEVPQRDDMTAIVIKVL